MNYPENDLDFAEVKITAVRGNETDGWTIDHDGLSFHVPKDSQITPDVGMIARFYPAPTFAQKRGLFLDGIKVFYKTPAEAQVEREEQLKNYHEEEERRKLEPKNPEPQIPGFEWDNDMAEISGFGSGYERACRTMVSQGCKWWSEHPNAMPSIHGFKQIYGIAIADNEDAKELETAMMAGNTDCTGAMHQCCLSHIFLWHKLGSWAAYQAKSKEMKIVHDAEDSQPDKQAEGE